MTDSEVSIGQVKRDISELVNRVAFGGERIILTSRGKPKAALVSVDDLRRLNTFEGENADTFIVDSLEMLVAAIRRLPRDDAAIEPARVSLAELLKEPPGDVAFDRAAWEAEWNAVENEMRRIETDDLARDLAG